MARIGRRASDKSAQTRSGIVPPVAENGLREDGSARDGIAAAINAEAEQRVVHGRRAERSTGITPPEFAGGGASCGQRWRREIVVASSRSRS